MTKVPILLVGAGGHSHVCIDVIEQEGRYAVAGLIGTPEEIGTKIMGYSVLGSDEDLSKLIDEFSHALVTIGQIKNPEPRMRLFDLLQRAGYTLPTIVSPRAYVSPHATVGAGTVVVHGAVVNAGAVVGCNCIINSQSLIEHDAVIADHCHIATAAQVNGGVRVGYGTFVGSGSCLRQSVEIGERCVIGMGQSVIKNCESGARVPPPKELL